MSPTSVAEALEHVAPGARVLATPGCATPETLLAGLGVRAAAAPGITLAAGLLLGSFPFRAAVEAGLLRFRTWHVTGPGRDLVRAGHADYVPVRAFDVPRLVAATTDVLLLRVTPPDGRGYCSFGPSATYTRVALDAARLVIAEVDESLPRTWGDTAVHVSELDHLVEADTPTCTFTRGEDGGEATAAIASSVVDLLPQHPTVQLGIGAVPEAIAAALGRADLGRLRLVGFASDFVVDLFEAGALDPAGVFPEAAVRTVEAMGSRRMLDFIDANPAVALIPSTTCHDPRWLGGLPRLVSINTAVEIDLSGQVAAETARGAVVAGVGGSFDFVEGAHFSSDGLRVIALQATTADGRTSKIVPRLAAGTPVNIPRHSVDVVVTEHGVARLAGRSERERAEALVAVAAPAFRDALADGLTA